MLSKLLAGESLYDYPPRLLCKDGSIKYVLIHSNAYFEDGNSSHTRCFTRDVRNAGSPIWSTGASRHRGLRG